MVSIWWVVLAFVAGGYMGAMLVSLMRINPAHEDSRLELPAQPAVDDTELGLSA